MEENTYLNNESDLDDFELLNGKKKENQITRKLIFLKNIINYIYY